MYDSGEFVSLYERLKASSYGFRNGCIQSFTIFLIFSFQQFILYYIIFYVRNEPRFLYLLIFDAIIAVYLLNGAISTKGHSSARISVQWRLCCTSTVIKIAGMLLLRNNPDLTFAGGFNPFAAEDYLSFIGFYLTPIVYILFSRMSNRFLFSREKRNVNVDELLHSDLALATAVDLWDIVIMVNHLLRRYRVHEKRCLDSAGSFTRNGNFLAYALLCIISTFLLGFVSPTVDSDLAPGSRLLERRISFWLNIQNYFRFLRRKNQDDSKLSDETWPHDRGFEGRDVQNSDTSQIFKAKSAPNGQYLDMFTIAKYTFLIGFCLIDIPFFVYRLVHLLKENVFSLMIYKNILGMVLRPYRLTLSQLAERDSAKGWQSAFFEAQPMCNDPSAKKVIHDDLKVLDEENESDTELQLSRKLTDRAMLRRGLSSTLSSNTRSYTRYSFNKRGSTMTQDNSLMRSTTEFRTATLLSSDRGTDATNNQDTRSFTDDPLLPRLRFNPSNTSIPDTNWSSSTSNHESDPTEAVKAEYKVESERRLLLLRKLKRHRDIPVTTLGYITLFSKLRDVFCSIFKVEPNFDMDASEFLVTERPFEFMRMLTALCITLVSRVAIVIVCYVYRGKVRSPRFIFGYDIFTAGPYELLVYGIVIFAPLIYSMLFIRVQGCGFIGCILFWLQEIVKMGSYVTCICCLRDLIQTPSSVLFAIELAILLQWPIYIAVLTVSCAGAGNLNIVRLMYILCKHSFCPVSLNYKLFCLDIMKSTTIADSLLHSQWNYHSYRALFSSLCCSFSPTKTELMVILVDLLMRFIYVIFSQTMRVLMLRKFEIHYLIMRLTNSISFDYLPPTDTFSMSSESTSQFVTPADVDEYIKDQGLLSSPGVLVPPFF
ncbi:uncharacterized protein BXIN_2144 [Babesia sp. Xinjiang]|uniref:uncharacterized protein n=1 Tax=Babesia sp. Xinjiang TaxID=462227 RepID=UPI000A24CA9C|nr:uncharacterized protein BXIN_2144 [Babesia sp. Xinjiang]ORM40515.1 hypothetical protein BXIN_2144 [Babesia sp. Xinjiang]